jgi:hypothetical protein
VPAPAPAPVGRRDPFGLGAPPAAPAAAQALETPVDDWSDVGSEPAAPAAFAPPPPPAPEPEEEMVDISEPSGLELAAEPELAPPPPPPPPAPIELPEEEEAEPELAPMHAFVPPPEKVGHKPAPPAPRAAPAPAAPAGDGGEALLREALSQASRETIERVIWEVVPQLAETIIRENLDRLVRERQG